MMFAPCLSHNHCTAQPSPAHFYINTLQSYTETEHSLKHCQADILREICNIEKNLFGPNLAI